MKYPNFGAIVDEMRVKRANFFRLIFGHLSEEGYICIAFKPYEGSDLEQFFFKYPEQFDLMLTTIDEKSKELKHAYFCPQLLSHPKRTKNAVSLCPTAWADLDTCDPKLLVVQPTVLVSSSPGRWQALWVMYPPVSPADGEDISRRIAYNYAAHGADRSGWDLSQLLRIPYTLNLKYHQDGDAPVVHVVNSNSRIFRFSDFSKIPEAPALREIAGEPTPEILNEDPLEIMQSYRATLNPMAFGLFHNEPDQDQDWSKLLWRLGNLLCEAGMNRVQVFTVLDHARCNKYRRDLRSRNDLWREVKRIFIKKIEIQLHSPTDLPVSPIISDEELAISINKETFVERYIVWAKHLTDAAPQFHQAGAFTLLSALLSGSIVLPTSFGTLIPNLWFMIAADSTISRKTTAMRIATSLMYEINEQLVFATDGTMEGILSNLSTRDGKPAVFYRDEFTGLLQAMSRKDYMSDMPEHLTKLYDGDPMRRLLRKEEIHVRKPIFLILSGGIRSKIQSLLNEEHIASGFIPRFVFITAETDMSRIRPVGPPIADNLEYREQIKNELLDIATHYTRPTQVTSDNRSLGSVEPMFRATLTDEAWKRYNQLETTMTADAINSGLEYLTPIYDRLAKSTLKAALLLAASRKRESNLEVSLEDIIHATYYCRGWRNYANEMISGLGKSPEERMIDRITILLRNAPNGIPRAQLMNDLKLTAKSAPIIFDTMIQRRIMFANHVGQEVVYCYERVDHQGKPDS